MKYLVAMLMLLACFSATSAQDFEIYVSDAGNFQNPPWQILKFDANGENPELFTDEGVSWPQDILFLEERGEVLISNFLTHRVNRHDAETGALIDAFAIDLRAPTRLKIGPDGLLYVLQWGGTNLVRRYELDGTPLGNFTSVGVNQSIGLDWDDDGNLYVSSFVGDHVRRFDPQGNDLGLFVTSNLAGPTDIWFDDAGRLVVNDYNGNRVQRFRADGTFDRTLISGIANPEGIAVLPSGNLLLGNSSSTIAEFSPDGSFVGNRVAAAAGNLIQANAVTIRMRGAPPIEINQGLSGSWYDPFTVGQGFLLDVDPATEFLFVAWFTFETAAGKIGAGEQRWLTAQGNYSGGVAELTLFNTRNGRFNDPEPTESEAVGTLRLQFSDCSNGTAEYELPDEGLEGTIPIQRLLGGADALCQSLLASGG